MESKLKLIQTEEAVGHVLCHDMTQIIPGVMKDARFRKGHVVTEADIPVLLSMGKEHLYVWEKPEGMLHEDEAAKSLLSLCINEGMHATDTKEGKIELIADRDGLFQVDTERLYAVNDIEELMIAVRHTNTAVKAGDKLAGMRVIPLVIDEQKLEQAREASLVDSEGPILSLLPWKIRTAGIITTGSEVEKGRVEDQFTPVVEKKLADFQIEVKEKRLTGDDMERTKDAILQMKEAGLDLIICTGGMSVDPDGSRAGSYHLYRGHERGPGRPDAGRDPGFRRRHRYLWRSGIAGSHAVPGVFFGRHTGYRSPGMRDVCEGNHL